MTETNIPPMLVTIVTMRALIIIRHGHQRTLAIMRGDQFPSWASSYLFVFQLYLFFNHDPDSDDEMVPGY